LERTERNECAIWKNHSISRRERKKKTKRTRRTRRTRRKGTIPCRIEASQSPWQPERDEIMASKRRRRRRRRRELVQLGMEWE